MNSALFWVSALIHLQIFLVASVLTSGARSPDNNIDYIFQPIAITQGCRTQLSTNFFNVDFAAVARCAPLSRYVLPQWHCTIPSGKVSPQALHRITSLPLLGDQMPLDWQYQAATYSGQSAAYWSECAWPRLQSVLWSNSPLIFYLQP